MERLTERTAVGILVKEDYGKEVLKTLCSCYGEKPTTHYTNCADGYCAMEKLADYEDAEQQAHSYSTMMLYEIADMIEDAPTAYDTDKVVEQLEEYREEMEQFKCGGMLSDMIEVVKAGGVDG